MRNIITLLWLSNHYHLFFFFFERQIWITDGTLEYHRVASRTTRSYPSPLGNNAYTPITEPPDHIDLH
ncbi:hypothetical protein Hanom_Chr05g00408411 [Helianthus anomalus]